MTCLRITYLFFLILIISTSAIAGENNFATTSSTMIEQLTTAPVEEEQSSDFLPKVRLRGANNSETPKGLLPVANLRGVQRMKHNPQGQIVTETIMVPVEQSTAHVNLKIEFDSNSYAIRPESFPLLAELGKALSSNELQGRSFYINGHTDSDGSDGHNLSLSLNRAQSVKQFVTANYPIPASQLTVIGYGESMPISGNDTSSGKQMNRRVEVVINVN